MVDVAIQGLLLGFALGFIFAIVTVLTGVALWVRRRGPFEVGLPDKKELSDDT